MKTTMTKEEFKEFTTSVDWLQQEHNINIPYMVEEVKGKFVIELLEKIDVEKLDNLLENT